MEVRQAELQHNNKTNQKKTHTQLATHIPIEINTFQPVLTVTGFSQLAKGLNFSRPVCRRMTKHKCALVRQRMVNGLREAF